MEIGPEGDMNASAVSKGNLSNNQRVITNEDFDNIKNIDSSKDVSFRKQEQPAKDFKGSFKRASPTTG